MSQDANDTAEKFPVSGGNRRGVDPLTTPPTRPVRIRVFVSSTFQDLQAERAELTRTTFAHLRRLCESRGISFSVVDLRWGIRDDDARTGQVLEICLDEVDRCRPFFVGILGSRYGWVPPQFPQELCDRHPWLADYAGRSITELEILHGALLQIGRGQSENVPALFYFRRPTDGVDSEDGESVRKLQELKERIRQSDVCESRDEFSDAEELASFLQRDLERLLDEVAPSHPLDDLDWQQTSVHWQYAVTRAEAYLSPRRAWLVLDDALRAKSTSVLITGAAGTGKSALLAHWLVQRFGGIHTPVLFERGWFSWLRRNPPAQSLQESADVLWLYHFVGASEDSFSTAGLIRRWTRLLLTHLGEDQSISEEPQQLRSLFLAVLQKVSAQRRIVLLIDGVDDLHAESAGLANLRWLPYETSANISLIVSCRTEVLPPALRRRIRRTVVLGTVAKSERGRLVEHLLYEGQSRRLSRSLVSQIATSSVAGHPQRLVALCEELRAIGKHANLAAQVAHYTSPTQEIEFYQLVLDRLVGQFVVQGRPIIREMLTLLAASRDGLSEAELRDLIVTDETSSANLQWSAALMSAGHVIAPHGPLLSFATTSVRAAVHALWISDSGDLDGTHARLAEYFQSRPTTGRTLDELPWQLTKTRAWEQLAELLTDPEMLARLWRHRSTDVRRYWATLESQTGWSPADVYGPLASVAELESGQAWIVCQILCETGFDKLALSFAERAVESPSFTASAAGLAAFSLLTELSAHQADWKQAAESLERYEQLASRRADVAARSHAHLLRAELLRLQNEPEAALKAVTNARQEYEAAGDTHGSANCEGLLGVACFDLGRTREALVHFQEQSRLGEELGDIDVMRDAISHRNGALLALQRLDEALHGFAMERQWCEEFGDRKGLADCCGNEALALMDLARYDDALSLLDLTEQLHRELDNVPALALTRLRQAFLFGIKLGQRAAAMPLALEGLRLAQECQRHDLEDKCVRLLADLDGHNRSIE